MNTSQLLLPASSLKPTYYVNFYCGEDLVLFNPYYPLSGNKVKAIKDFLLSCGNCDLYDSVTLTENIGMQIADKSEPFLSKNAIVRVLASKAVPF
jgi:hypothetical protein